MKFVLGLKCVFCGATYSTRIPYTCPSCGVTGILDVLYDYSAIARILTRKALSRRPEHSHWRYRELLPIRSSARVPALSVGWTPLTAADSLARHIGVKTLFLKDDGRNPTGSLKDRASALGVVKAQEKRQKIIACASTGNAASSLAGMAAAIGMRSVIFVPQRAPEPKVTQLLIFGATVLKVLGSYEDAFQLCQQACERWGWYNRNCAINPYLFEGKKTVGLEVCEQLAWRMPDWVAVSVGDGCTIAGVWKAFREMKTLGLIERTPRMLGVQAEGAAPITEAYRSGQSLRPVDPHTIADSIAVGVPRNWKKALLAVQESDGDMINVSDERDPRCHAVHGTACRKFRGTGRCDVDRRGDGAQAAAQGVVGRRAEVVAMVTGNGLKDIRSAQAAVKPPIEISRDADVRSTDFSL